MIVSRTEVVASLVMVARMFVVLGSLLVKDRLIVVRLRHSELVPHRVSTDDVASNDSSERLVLKPRLQWIQNQPPAFRVHLSNELWLICPLDDLPPGSFAPWLVRPLADSPTHRGRFAPWLVSLRYDDRNSVPTTFFSFFSKVFYFDVYLSSTRTNNKHFYHYVIVY